ncbi:MAG: hypothetical protein LBR36_04475 [Bacteroidales bacterium]|nr:hypothetical protein [Bacteroidales bacterium]
MTGSKESKSLSVIVNEEKIFYAPIAILSKLIPTSTVSICKQKSINTLRFSEGHYISKIRSLKI